MSNKTMIQCRKFLTLFIVLFGTLAFSNKASADISWNLVKQTFFTATLDTSTVTKVELEANIFDDWGTITIISPSGATSVLSTPPAGGCLSSIATGDISSSFLDGFGPKVYTINVGIIDGCGGGNWGGWGNLKVTETAPPPLSCADAIDFTAGLVPCGRFVDNPDTVWDETQPCTLCHVVPLISNITNYSLSLIGIIAVLLFAITALMSITALGGVSGLQTAKQGTRRVVFGFMYAFVAWLIINTAMIIFGYIDPMGDGSWKKVDCNLDTTASFCGDGIVNGLEVCDGGTQTCAEPVSGLPGYCPPINGVGTQSCNSCCTGWNSCVITTAPAMTANNYGDCTSATIYANNYSCCELTDCQADGCCAGANSANSILPGGYTERSSLPFSGGNCKLGQNGMNWAISINHTTAGYRCWN